MFPFTRATHFGVTLFLTHIHIGGRGWNGVGAEAPWSLPSPCSAWKRCSVQGVKKRGLRSVKIVDGGTSQSGKRDVLAGPIETGVRGGGDPCVVPFSLLRGILEKWK